MAMTFVLISALFFVLISNSYSQMDDIQNETTATTQYPVTTTCAPGTLCVVNANTTDATTDGTPSDNTTTDSPPSDNDTSEFIEYEDKTFCTLDSLCFIISERPNSTLLSYWSPCICSRGYRCMYQYRDTVITYPMEFFCKPKLRDMPRTTEVNTVVETVWATDEAPTVEATMRTGTNQSTTLEGTTTNESTILMVETTGNTNEATTVLTQELPAF